MPCDGKNPPREFISEKRHKEEILGTGITDISSGGTVELKEQMEWKKKRF